MYVGFIEGCCQGIIEKMSSDPVAGGRPSCGSVSMWPGSLKGFRV